MKPERYKIIPTEPPEPGFLDFRKPDAWGEGCFLFIIAFIAGIIIDGMNLGTLDWIPLVVLEFFALLITGVIYYVKRVNALSDARELWMQERRTQSKKEAVELSLKANGIEKSFWTTIQSLPKLLADAQLAVDAAARDYSERAFGPFWDNIERAASNLAAFNASAKRIYVSTGEYQEILKGRKHNFPPLVVRQQELPDPIPIAERFKQMVRTAQRDYEFSVIWEHRKTREVLIQGFGSLAEAVEGLSWTLEDSMVNLKNTISESSDKIVREQRKMRESFDDAVDKGKKSRGLY